MNPSPPVIRRAGPADAAVLSSLADRLFVQTFVEELKVPYPQADLEAFLAYANAPEAMARRLADPAFGVWMAEAGGEAVGYALAGAADIDFPGLEPAHGMLHRLYLAPAWRGAGLAGPLLNTALDWLETTYGSRPWLTVFSLNLRAQAFYARHGFERVGEYDYPVGGWTDREFVMRRR